MFQFLNNLLEGPHLKWQIADKHLPKASLRENPNVLNPKHSSGAEAPASGKAIPSEGARPWKLRSRPLTTRSRSFGRR